MIFERVKAAGIAHNSYLIGPGSDAAVIDPLMLEDPGHLERAAGFPVTPN